MTQAAMPQLSTDFDTELEQVKRSRAQIDLLRKQMVQQGLPQGEMIGKRWTPPTMQDYLQHGVNAYATYAGEKQANEKESVLNKAMQAQAAQLMGSRPQGTPAIGASPGIPSVEQAGPAQEGQGPPMSVATPATEGTPAVPPTQEEKLAWAQKLQQNPLTRALGAHYAQDTLISEPDRIAAREEKSKENALNRVQRAAEHRDKLAQQGRELDFRIQTAGDNLELKGYLGNQLNELKQQQITATAEHNKALLDFKKSQESPVQAKERQKLEGAVESAHKRVGLLNEVEKILPGSTGSRTGAAIDEIMKLTPWSLSGADAVGKLKALEGELTLHGPKYGGGSSNQDVIDYKAAVGAIADPTTSVARRLEAVQTVQRIAKQDLELQRGKAAAYNTRAGDFLPKIDLPDLEPGTAPVVPKTGGLPKAAGRVSSGAIGGLQPQPNVMPPPGGGIPPGANVQTNVSQGPPVTVQLPPAEMERAGILMSEYRKPLQPVPGEDPTIQAARHATDKKSIARELERIGVDAETGGPLQRRATDKVPKPKVRTWNQAKGAFDE